MVGYCGTGLGLKSVFESYHLFLAGFRFESYHLFNRMSNVLTQPPIGSQVSVQNITQYLHNLAAI